MSVGAPEPQGLVSWRMYCIRQVRVPDTLRGRNMGMGSEQADSKPASVHTGWESLRKHAEQADSKRASVHTGWESLRKHAEQANSKPASVHTVWESLRKHAEAAPASI